jgi:hypothetical protein
MVFWVGSREYELGTMTKSVGTSARDVIHTYEKLCSFWERDVIHTYGKLCSFWLVELCTMWKVLLRFRNFNGEV